MNERLVCLGDSFTEGMCDDLRPDGHHLGWADRVAVALARRAATAGGRLEYANLSVRGKLLDQVVAVQVPVVHDLAGRGLVPTVLTFHAGPNDVLRRGTDLPGLFTRYERAVAGLVPLTGRLLLFTAIGRAGGSGRLAQLVASRFAAFNDNVRAVAARHGALVVDMDAAPVLTDRRLWWVDRLHLNAAGHTRVAAAVLETLGVDDGSLLGGPVGWWREPLPPVGPSRRRDDLSADVEWARRHLLPWVGRRLRGVSSGDGREPKDPALRPVVLPAPPSP